MKVSVLFFGATAAVTNKRQLQVDESEEARAKQVFDQLLAEYPGLTSHRLLFSINQEYATGDEILRDGDELAVFTEVSGG